MMPRATKKKKAYPEKTWEALVQIRNHPKKKEDMDKAWSRSRRVMDGR